MSTSVILDSHIPRVGGLCEKNLGCSVVSPMGSLSIETSSKEQNSVESEDLDSRSLADSDFRKNSYSPPTPGTSPSVTSLLETNSRLVSPKENYPFASHLKFGGHIVSSKCLDSPQDEYLLFVEPGPVHPPKYDTLPPGGIPKYPILDTCCAKEDLPIYSPAAYKIGVVCRKLEWLSPYEASPARSWKTLIMELNSTQLNFYQIPSSLENHFLNFVSNYLRFGFSRLLNLESVPECYRSLVTTNRDLHLSQLCERLEFFKHDNHIEDNDDESVISMTNSLHSKSLKNNKNKRLIRSFSLQHARVGLASDYTKKTNVLRLRLENEQFLLNFPTAQDLIEWNLGLSVGRDVAMDLSEREIPRYRTVPRRRRTHLAGPMSYYHEVVARRNRAHSDSQFETNSSLRSKFSKLKHKLSSLNLKGNSNQAQKPLHQQHLQHFKQCRDASNASLTISCAPVGSMSSLSVQRELNRQDVCPTNGVGFSFASGEDEDECSEQYNPIVAHLSNVDDDDDGDDDIQNLSDLHRSDDEDEDDVDLDDVPDFQASVTRSRRNTGTRNIAYSDGDEKWNPFKKQESERRFTRNCLKCIKPLTFDESWVNKVLMKPATVSPLCLAYLRTRFPFGDSKDSSYTSLVSLPGLSHFEVSNTGSSPYRKRAFSQKDMIFSLADASLGRIPNHHLKEYVVGSHSLIPKEV